jgi:malate/lactate dehydrogenase
LLRAASDSAVSRQTLTKTEQATRTHHENRHCWGAAIENDVRFANITIVEGIGASQYGIGMVCARISEILLRDERIVVPIKSERVDVRVAD